MSAVAPLSLPRDEPDRSALNDQSIDDLDAAICQIARHLHAETYRLLMLVREFDDRFGFTRWSFNSCADRLGCDGQLLALVEDDRGRPLALGRKQRIVSPRCSTMISSTSSESPYGRDQ